MKVEQKAEEYLKAQCQKRKEEFVIRMPEVYIADIPQAFIDGYHECQKEYEWHLTKNELPELQTGNKYSDPVLCFRYHINNHGKKLKVYDLDRWNSENDIWEISGMKKDQIEAWMYLLEPPEEI